MERSLTDQQMVEILEGIARDGSNKAAQIAAIKQLRAMAGGDEDERPERGVMDAPARQTSHLRAA